MNPLINQLNNSSSNNNNDLYNKVMNMCQGKNPKDVFYSECQKRGVNPNTILNMMNNKKF